MQSLFLHLTLRAVHWLVQEPVSPRLAKGKSPVSHWSALLLFTFFSFFFFISAPILACERIIIIIIIAVCVKLLVLCVTYNDVVLLGVLERFQIREIKDPLNNNYAVFLPRT